MAEYIFKISADDVGIDLEAPDIKHERNFVQRHQCLKVFMSKER